MECRTPQAAIDVVMAQPPLHDLPPGFDGPDLNEVFKKGLDIPPAAPVPPTKKRGLVGVRYNDLSIVAWNLADNGNIRVTARKITERLWHIDGYVADTPRISATVFGGKWATLRYVRFICNGLRSRAKRLKKIHAKRALALSPEAGLKG